MKYYLLPLILFLHFNNTFSQKTVFNDITISIGYTAYSPDKRLENLPPVLVSQLLNDSYNRDKEFSIYLSKDFLSTKYFDLSAGLGYFLYKSNYSTWVNNFSFGNFNYNIITVKDYYTKNGVMLPLEIKKRILRINPNLGLNLGTTILPLFTIHKKVFPFSKFVFEFNNVEINPYIAFQFKKWAFSSAYRVANLVKTDGSVYSTNNPGLVGKSTLFIPYDTYNTPKWRFNLSYTF